jgi:hypothetical protein
MTSHADVASPLRNPMDPGVCVKKEDLFTTINSSGVYQDSDNRKAVRNLLRHRHGEFHVNREVI